MDKNVLEVGNKEIFIEIWREGGRKREREGKKEGMRGEGWVEITGFLALVFSRLERGPDSRSSGPESDDCELASESVCTL